MCTTVGVVHNGERFSPIALTRKQPIAQAISNGGLSVTVCLQPLIHSRLCIGNRCKSVEGQCVISAVDVFAIASECAGPCTAIRTWCDSLLFKPCGSGHGRCLDGQVVCTREFEVALVATWHRHDGAGAVSHEHIIGNVNRHIAASDGVGGEGTSEDARLLL